MSAITPRCSPFACAIAACAFAASAVAQQWQQLTPARSDHAIVFDTARQRTVLFGGRSFTFDPGVRGDRLTNDLWECDGARWQRRPLAFAPSPRSQHAMAFDSTRQRTVLFGGRGIDDVLGDTWEYDGAAWTLRTFAPGPLHAPTARERHALTFDSGRGVAILYGGLDALQRATGDTWEYDGTRWVSAFASSLPLPGGRADHGLAFDAARNKTVLTDPTTSETFEYDGSIWHRAAAMPQCNAGGTLTWDAVRTRTVYFDGRATFEYDGTAWAQQLTAHNPPRLTSPRTAFDPPHARIVLFGGFDLDGYADSAATWSYDGTDWSELAPQPAPRIYHGLVWENARGQALLFGGNHGAADTWRLLGDDWQRLPTAHAPSPRMEHAMTYDAATARTLLFGGLDFANVFLADTWSFDGVDWTQVATVAAPPARAGAGLAVDAARQRAVLFGGFDTAGSRGDTWEFDGVGWHATAPLASPPADFAAQLAWDRARQRIVDLDDNGSLWDYDGGTWSQRSPRNAAPSPDLDGLVYDPQRDRLLVLDHRSFPGDVWELAGDVWQPLGTWTTASRLTQRRVVFDPLHRRLVAFGGMTSTGTSASGQAGDTIAVGLPTTASWSAAGACPGAAELAAPGASVPSLGSTFPLLLLSLPTQPGLAVLAFGPFGTAANGGPPLDLQRLGVTGCSLEVLPQLSATIVVAYAGTIALVPLAIPNAPALAGLALGVQALAFDSNSATRSATLTNALLLHID